MNKIEVIDIINNGKKIRFNGYLTKIVSILAYKYGKVKAYKFIEKENKKITFYYLEMKGVRRLIQEECMRNFHFDVSKKQIKALFSPKKGKRRMKFPYTAMIIIEAIYNLLKQDDGIINPDWKKVLYFELTNSKRGELNYEKFCIGELIENIVSVDTKEKIGDLPYKKIYQLYITSRNQFYKKAKPDWTMKYHIEANFPWNKFGFKDIPESMRGYAERHIYIRE